MSVAEIVPPLRENELREIATYICAQRRDGTSYRWRGVRYVIEQGGVQAGTAPDLERLVLELCRIPKADNRERDTRTCAHCGNDFAGLSSARYCSTNCRVKAHRAKAKA